jgi:predicted secreted protein
VKKRIKSLAETHPEVAKQWHPTLNGDLTPGDVTPGSNKKVWWKCDVADDHEWEATVATRVGGSGCSVCANRKIVKSNCLATTHPEIAKYWHPKKNNHLNPYNIGAGSDKKVWWKCDKGDDHEWEARLYKQTKRVGCLICSGHKIVKSNSLSTTHPEIAKYWHPTKNGPLKPHEIGYGSGKKVWWKCDRGDDHEWKMSVDQRVRNKNCSICNNQIVVKSNCLATTHPEIANEWHPTKNGKLTPNDVTAGSHKRVWWKCDKGNDHEWKTQVREKIQTGCPVCTNKKIVKSNCLTTTHPEIANEWHPTKNGKLTTNDVTAGSHKRVWWKCDKGDDHEWIVSTKSRLSFSTFCPVCSNQKVVKSNCLATTHPEIANEWHPTKNGKLTTNDVTAGSHKRVWWKCDKGDDHEWKSSVANVSRDKSNCPFCTLTPQSKQELTITFELMKFFKNVDPKGFKTRLDGHLRAIDIYIPELNLCVEFDGSYWHKGKRELDKIKSEMLLDEGFKLIRVREEPLKKIYDTDVISKQPYNGKQVTNDILSVILNMFDLNPKLISRIKEYQSKDVLQNEKGLEKYIDQILTEKAEKQ